MKAAGSSGRLLFLRSHPTDNAGSQLLCNHELISWPRCFHYPDTRRMLPVLGGSEVSAREPS
jgi:hypothetical protein